MVRIYSTVLPLASFLLHQSHLAWSSPIDGTGELATRASSHYLDWVHDSVNFLNKKWYNEKSGYWNGQWWQSANAMLMLGDVATVDPSYRATIEKIYVNSVVKAATGGNGVKFYGKYYDDMGWWLMAWVKAYDVTGNSTYLQTAETIFDKMLTGLNTTCGGIWWSSDRAQISAIADELYLAAGAALTNRASAGKKDYYKRYAVTQWDWFKNSTLINANNLVCEGLDHNKTNPTCKSGGNSCKSLSYTQGVILDALIELDKFDPKPEYLQTASKIANAAIKRFSKSGIMVDGGSRPDHDQAQFKGAFARNLMLLHQKQPEDVFVDFFKTNADSIWAKDRNTTDGQLGPNWQGPFYDESVAKAAGADMPGHNSATSCLLGAYVAVRS